MFSLLNLRHCSSKAYSTFPFTKKFLVSNLPAHSNKQSLPITSKPRFITLTKIQQPTQSKNSAVSTSILFIMKGLY